MDGFNAYACRHSAATRVRRAVGAAECQAFLGHDSPAMSAHYGAKQDDSLAARAALRAG